MSDKFTPRPKSLIEIGYWRSREDPQWPDPAWFVDKDWDTALRKKIITYLHAGEPLAWAGGFSWCRFRCGDTALGSAEQTDGVYIWPEGLAHYLERHDVRLPDAFVTHALQRGQPGKIVLPGVPKVNTRWWQEQKGWRGGESFGTPGLNGRLILEPFTGSPSIDRLRFLRLFAAHSMSSTKALCTALQSGEPLVLSEKLDYSEYIYLLEQANSLGLILRYEETPEPELAG